MGLFEGQPVYRYAALFEGRLRAMSVDECRRYMKDAEGHEHGSDGKFVSRGSGGSRKGVESQEGGGDTGGVDRKQKFLSAVAENTVTARRSQIVPLHGLPDHIRNDKKIKVLSRRMAEHGWQGLPLLAIDDGEQYQAWTGTHRLAAAKIAGLEEIPIVMLDRGRLERAAKRLGFQGLHGNFGPRDDDERYQVIREAGYKVAALIAKLEVGKHTEE